MTADDQRPIVAGPDPLLVDSAAHVFVDDLEAPMLGDDEVHHLARVLRLRPGAAVTICDGAGGWRPARFSGSAVVEVDGQIRRVPRRSAEATICFALLKGDRNELVIQKLTEIGADRIVPITTQRTIVTWDSARERAQIERLRRVARSAAEQSRRVWLPEVSAVETFDAAASRPGATIAAPGGGAMTPAMTTLLVGPEGGWSPKELERPTPRVGFGSNILRAETGSIVGCALLVAFLTGQVRPTP